MHYFILTLVLAACVHARSAAQDSDKLLAIITLFDFATDESANWQIVDDGVMGGRSKGFVQIQDGHLRFTGKTVTQGGGFTSVRTLVDVDLYDQEGLELTVRGGGRSFEIELQDTNSAWSRRISRRARFDTSTEWSTVRIPFSALRASSFGRPVNASPIDLTNIVGLGFYIVDGQDGPFELEVDRIGAYGEHDRQLDSR